MGMTAFAIGRMTAPSVQGSSQSESLTGVASSKGAVSLVSDIHRPNMGVARNAESDRELSPLTYGATLALAKEVDRNEKQKCKCPKPVCEGTSGKRELTAESFTSAMILGKEVDKEER